MKLKTIYLNKSALRCSQFQVDIHTEKTSFIYTPHNSSFVQTICDRKKETEFEFLVRRNYNCEIVVVFLSDWN